MYFAMFDVPEEIDSDRRPPFDSRDYINFLAEWNIIQRLSSTYFTQSNGRAEVGVSTAKRVLLRDVDLLTGKLDNDKAVRAVMNHRNKHLPNRQESCPQHSSGE